MTTRTNETLSKLLLVACDQSYFDGNHPVSTEQALGYLDDREQPPPAEYQDSLIYKTEPQFTVNSTYKIVQIIDKSKEIGAKALIYKNDDNEIIVSFGGTDGIDGQDWVTNTQSVGWSQWEWLKKPKVEGGGGFAG